MKTSTFWVILLCITWFLVLPLFGAMSDYSFIQSTGVYNEITTPTQIHGVNIDDAQSPVIDIGFTFVYDDVPYTQFKASSNGFITFNPASTTTQSNLLATQLLIVAGFWDDLKTDATNSSVSYQLMGAAPNRSLVVQYLNMKWYYSFTPVNLINFQIVLNETSNTIQYLYGTMGTAPGTSATASIGITGAVAGNFMSITPADPAASYSTTTAFAAINATHVPYLTGKTYTFSPPVVVPNDLQVLSLTGNVTPSVGTSVQYTVSVRNRGTSPQSIYSVKLYNVDNLELASVAGPALAAGETSPVVLTWTPTVTGPMVLSGRVVLPGDQNPSNDASSPLNITVYPQGTTMVIIGTGTSAQVYPMYPTYGYVRDASLFTAAELGSSGQITGIQWDVAVQYGNVIPYRILMKTTTATALVAQPWATTIADAQLCAEGTVTINQLGWVYIPFTLPFTYTGDNLVVMVESNYGGTGATSSETFRYTTSATGSHHYMYADTTPPTTNGYLSTSRPNVGLTFASIPGGPQFAVSPGSYNYGQTYINTILNKSFSVVNIGGGELTVNSISISGSPFFSLQSLPTLPITLSGLQSTTFVARYNPTASGTHTATITITDNLNRTQHIVPVTGICVDPTIYTLPYTQNFDSVTIPNLPIEWSKVVTSPGNVTTSTTSPHSIPNCVYVYNSTSTAGPYLIAPPITSSIPIVTTRVKFWAKGATTYTLSVGVIGDPMDAATYEQTSSLTLTAAWAEYTVSFQTYAGTGHFIAFKHGNASTSQSIYIDDVMIEVTPQNDLAALSLTGDSTPSVGSATPYTVNVFNWGTTPQSNYTVKLYNNDNLELASLAGPEVGPGLTVQAVLNWTPTVAGATTIYGKVILTGDQNQLNDNTANKSILVQQAGTIHVVIGDGSQTNYYSPIASFYKNSLFENIYYPDEIGMGGILTSVAFDYSFVATNFVNKPIKIWFGVTDLQDLSAGWIPSTSLTLAYDGNVSCSPGQNTLVVQLQNPFSYAGGNLVMLVQRVMDIEYVPTTNVFYNQTVGTNRARRIYSDTVTYDPTAPATGTLTGQFPKTSLFFLPLDPNPHFSISPQDYNYGQTLTNTTVNKTFTIMNIGGGTTPLLINDVSITGSPFFSLQNVPTMPISLASGQSATFTARYNPTAAGTHSATINITDNLTARTVHPVMITATAVDVTIYTLPYFQNFDAVTIPNLPVDWSKVVASPGNVTTVTTTPHSTPNCVYVYNSTSTAGPYLISPPITPTIPIVTARVKFWAKGSTSYVLSVGVIADPLDAATYEQVSSLTLTTTWTEYVVGFQTYAGAGHFIAFKHGNAATSQSIYVDDIMIEVTPQNDLAVLALNGNTTPTVGIATQYTVNVFNWGTNPQSNYSVKLYNNDNLELASVSGPAVNAGLAADVPINWTPTIAGADTIYAKVVLTGDQNNLNDNSPNMSVNVMPVGTVMITIGTGITTQRQPMGILYGYERDASLFLNNEINLAGAVTGVQWYCATTAVAVVPYRILIKTTNDATLSAIPWTTMITDAQLVAEGTRTFSQLGWQYIPFTTPFPFTGGNLIVLIETNYGGTGTTSPAFRYTVAPTGMHQYWATDSNPPTGNGTLNTYRPNVGISFNVGGMGSIHGSVTSGGNPLTGAVVSVATTTLNTTIGTDGLYNFPFVFPGTYQVTCSKVGYGTQTLTAVVVADQQTMLNFNMSLLPVVNVTGYVYGSDAPTTGLAGATVSLEGVIDYTGTTNAAGQFTITDVLSSTAFNFTISKSSYQNATGTINIGATNYNMGSTTLLELTLPPGGVQAVENLAQTVATITWRVPGTGGALNTDDFEIDNGGWVPTSNWTNPVGDWGWSNAYNVSNYIPSGDYISSQVPPTAAHSGTGLWGTNVFGPYTNSGGFNYLTKTFNLSGVTGATLRFWSWNNLFGNFDYAQVKVNGTVVYGPTTTSGSNPSWQEISVSLAAYDNNPSVVISFEMYATTVVNYAGWYIDDVYVGPSGRVFSSKSKSLDKNKVINDTNQTRNREIQGYKVWRLQQGQETTENSWIPLTVNAITDTFYVDNQWGSLANGNYKWAIKTTYTNDVMSAPSFSNVLRILPFDLSAISINGTTTPSIGTASTYTVGIRNTGTTAQAAGAYTVKLMGGTAELASVPGPAIAVGASQDIQIIWTPTVPGPMAIIGKVILPSDTVPANDETSSIQITVFPTGVVNLTVGDGSQTNYYSPVSMYYKNSLFENIYLRSELNNFIGVVLSVGFYNDFTTANITNKPTKIWLGTTTQTDLSTGWIPSTNMTLVFDGNVNYPMGQNLINIPLAQPFVYLEGNLVMLVQRPMDTVSYASTDKFLNQTIGTNRARRVYSSTITYDPAAPATGTLTGQFPKTSFFVLPGGVGHLTGNVYGAGNILLDNATVQILNGGSATTNALGHYMIQNIIAETYQVTASRFGYNPLTLTVVIPEDSTVTQNFTLTQMPTVTVTGTIVGSDAPGVGIAGATINLNGMEDYTATTNAAGLFSITGVYANQTYDYQASAVGYQMFEGSTTVGATEHNMGTITVSEIAYTPRNITATQNENHTAVTVTWLAPDPNAVDITQNFESATFPPTDWARTITNTGVGANGVAFTWCRFGTVVDGTTTVTPPEGSWQCGFWWHYQHQDEWLITPQFNCPQSAHLDFGTYVFRGSANLDHYYVKISNNNGADWTVLWDASTQTGGWNNYQTPIVIDLSAYAGQQVKIAWHADDHNDEGMWYNWFIDNVVISNTVVTLRFSEDQLTTKSASVKDSQLSVINSDVHTSRATDRNSLTYDRISPVTKVNSNSRTHGRSLLGYQVWRLLQGQEQNETAWVPLTTGPFTTSPLTDSGWAALAPGTYKWAVKAVYTGSVLSLAAYSNTVQKIQEPQGVLTGFVRNQNNLPISGAVITAGSFTTTTNASGSYTLTINTGTYSVTCTATGYQAQTLTNITINANQTTTQNFTMQPTVANQDIVEVTATALKGNFPNPFNPATMINYDVKVAAPVRIDIYNLKGQLIRTLVNEVKANGHHQILWDGKDNNGCLVASGVYHYRMRAGAYKADRMMMLMK